MEGSRCVKRVRERGHRLKNAKDILHPVGGAGPSAQAQKNHPPNNPHRTRTRVSVMECGRYSAALDLARKCHQKTTHSPIHIHIVRTSIANPFAPIAFN
jgi:hypothetical protein